MLCLSKLKKQSKACISSKYICRNALLELTHPSSEMNQQKIQFAPKVRRHMGAEDCSDRIKFNVLFCFGDNTFLTKDD